MSEKGRRSRAWDEQHLRGPLLWPVKAVVRVFSSITLAVILLVLVALYGVSASVPVGLLVLGLTYAFYGLTVLLAIALGAMLPAWLLRRTLRGKSGAAAFALPLVAGILLTPVMAYAWYRFAWPALHYDPATGQGVQFFSGFVERYRSVTLRRLPGVEMSELEYYSWWPLRVILLAFVVNMVVATVRRIEFSFKNIGVLTVHTGIIVIALGSVYYSGLKLEGDTLLLAGRYDPELGKPGPGPSQDIFYDNTDSSLWVTQDRGWEQRPLGHVPRYNHYNLGAIGGQSAMAAARMRGPWEGVPDQGPLDIRVRGGSGLVDSDLTFRAIGYAYYAEPIDDYVQVDRSMHLGIRASARENPLRLVFLHSAVPDASGVVDSEKPVTAYTLLPAEPKERLSVLFQEDRQFLSVEYTMGPARGMSAARWRDLGEPLPEGALHGLVVEVPAGEGKEAFRAVYPASVGSTIRVGSTGYTLRVQELHSRPPFPIITPGYKDATSSVAVVRVVPPGGEADAFDRYVYHRFPELDQDILGTKEDGRPNRRDADTASIRIGFLDADHLAVYIDEDASGKIRAIVREPGGRVRVKDDIGPDGWIRDVVDKVSLRVGDRWEHAVKVARPRPVPVKEQDAQDVGTHAKAMLAVEVRSSNPALANWSTVAWLPYVRYMGMGMGAEKTVDVPDGRSVTLAFGRTMHRFPSFAIRLVDFQMISYDHRGAPRDYQSIVRVSPVDDDFEEYQHVTKLNAPLMAPFNFDGERSMVANVAGRLASGLSPHQFKLSQAGWDQQGWNQTQQQADAGVIPRAYAKFTILGVGNNPGIHVIALGGILMGVGIPWAFYVKPWLVQREKKKIQAMLAARQAAPGARATQGQGSVSAVGVAEVNGTRAMDGEAPAGRQRPRMQESAS